MPATGAALVRQMHDRYVGRWYRSLTFLQHNTRYRATGGEEQSRWMEYQSVPGRLRIDILPADSSSTAPTGSGILYEHDRVHQFDNGRKLSSASQVHPLLVLSADVYAQPVEVTLRQLDSLGIDTTRVHRDRWEGHPVFVAGAAPGDTTSTQFWVDADRLLLVRLIETRQTPAGRKVTTDYRFGPYQDVGGFSVPSEILFVRDGKPVWRETYTNVRVNVDLPDEMFNPERWKSRN